MKNKKILNLETRRDIYNHVLRFPGVHLSEICKKLSMKKNNVCYHLEILKKQGLIETTSSDGYTRFFPVKLVGKEAENIAHLFAKSYSYENKKRILSLFKYYIPGRNEKKIINLIKRPVPSEILGFLFPDYDFSLMEISRNLKKHWTTISFHLKKMIKLGIIEKISNGNEVRYKIKDYEYILRLSFMYSCWRQQVKSNGEFEYVVEVTSFDLIFDAFFEIFPHPYHI